MSANMSSTRAATKCGNCNHPRANHWYEGTCGPWCCTNFVEPGPSARDVAVAELLRINQILLDDSGPDAGRFRYEFPTTARELERAVTAMRVTEGV